MRSGYMILAMNSINNYVSKTAINHNIEYAYDYDKLQALYAKTRRFIKNLFEAKGINITYYGKYLKNKDYGYSINETVENILKPYIIDNHFPGKQEIEERLNKNDLELELFVEEFISENFDYEARKKMLEDLTEQKLQSLFNSAKGISPNEILMSDVEKLFNDFKNLHDEPTKPVLFFCGLSQKTTTILKFLILKEQLDKLLERIELTNKSLEIIKSM